MRIDIYADVICPWCYIGRQRLARALDRRPALRPQIHWQPFQLNPDMPVGGMERGLYLAAKFGGVEQARQVYGMIAATAEQDGIALALDRVRRTPNTLAAHRLVAFAAESGLQDRLVDVLHRAYFQAGADIGDLDVLADCAASAGLERATVAEFLAGDGLAAAVRTADAKARQLGIQAVPFFVFDRRYAMAGAQSPDAFLPLLDLGATAPELASAGE